MIADLHPRYKIAGVIHATPDPPRRLNSHHRFSPDHLAWLNREYLVAAVTKE